MSELNEFRFCKERLQQLCPSLPKDIIEELSLGWRIVHFDKREHLITAGRIQADAFMIMQGLVRAYYPTIDGGTTINFVAEGEFATHYTSFEQPAASRFSFQAMEPTTAIAFSYEYVYLLRKRRIEVETLIRLLLEHEYARLMAHIECLLNRNAEDRYRLFLRNFGYLQARISITDLASYLGVSRQNLTIIRKRLLTNDK